MHAVCASWIPEVYAEDYVKVEPFNVDKLDRKRFKLKCALCSTKGACIQCCYGRCAVAAHPMCALNPCHGFTRRIVKDENDDMLWEIFCKAHADAVKEPLKPKKIKNTNADDTATESSSGTNIYHKRGSGVRSFESDFGPDRNPNTVHESMMMLSRTNAVALGTEAIASAKSKASSLYGKRYTDIQAESMQNTQCSMHEPFRSLCLSDWPGQTGGEAMDLDHFWNVSSMSCPTDHPSPWTNDMLSTIRQYLDEVNQLSYQCPDVDTQLRVENELLEKLNAVIYPLVGNKSVSLLFDIEKRSEFQNKSLSNANLLTGSTSSVSEVQAMRTEEDFLTLTTGIDTSNASVWSTHMNNNILSVIFDDESNRILCEYAISPAVSEKEVMEPIDDSDALSSMIIGPKYANSTQEGPPLSGTLTRIETISNNSEICIPSASTDNIAIVAKFTMI